jgi:hypothetical protein
MNMDYAAKYTDQSIRAEGAEYYVKSILMMEFGIITSIASRNMPGYDLVAYNLESDRSCKISVKYRTASDSDGWRNVCGKYQYDFLVGIIGNRGLVSAASIENDPRKPFKARLFIFPKKIVEANVKRKKTHHLLENPLKSKTSKTFLDYENAWHHITEHLRYDKVRIMRTKDTVI